MGPFDDTLEKKGRRITACPRRIDEEMRMKRERIIRHTGQTRRDSIRNGRRGFTLVELIVVLVIVAIVAAVAIPAMLGFIDSADEKKYIADAEAALSATQAALTEIYNDGNNRFTPSRRRQAQIESGVEELKDDGTIEDQTVFTVWTQTQLVDGETPGTSDYLSSFTVTLARFQASDGKTVIYDGKDWTLYDTSAEADDDEAYKGRNDDNHIFVWGTPLTRGKDTAWAPTASLDPNQTWPEDGPAYAGEVTIRFHSKTNDSTVTDQKLKKLLTFSNPYSSSEFVDVTYDDTGFGESTSLSDFLTIDKYNRYYDSVPADPVIWTFALDTDLVNSGDGIVNTGGNTGILGCLDYYLKYQVGTNSTVFDYLTDSGDNPVIDVWPTMEPGYVAMNLNFDAYKKADAEAAALAIEVNDGKNLQYRYYLVDGTTKLFQQDAGTYKEVSGGLTDGLVAVTSNVEEDKERDETEEDFRWCATFDRNWLIRENENATNFVEENGENKKVTIASNAEGGASSGAASDPDSVDTSTVTGYALSKLKVYVNDYLNDESKPAIMSGGSTPTFIAVADIHKTIYLRSKQDDHGEYDTVKGRITYFYGDGEITDLDANNKDYSYDVTFRKNELSDDIYVDDPSMSAGTNTPIVIDDGNETVSFSVFTTAGKTYTKQGASLSKNKLKYWQIFDSKKDITPNTKDAKMGTKIDDKVQPLSFDGAKNIKKITDNITDTYVNYCLLSHLFADENKYYGEIAEISVDYLLVQLDSYEYKNTFTSPFSRYYDVTTGELCAGRNSWSRVGEELRILVGATRFEGNPANSSGEADPSRDILSKVSSINWVRKSDVFPDNGGDPYHYQTCYRELCISTQKVKRIGGAVDGTAVKKNEWFDNAKKQQKFSLNYENNSNSYFANRLEGYETGNFVKVDEGYGYDEDYPSYAIAFSVQEGESFKIYVFTEDDEEGMLLTKSMQCTFANYRQMTENTLVEHLDVAGVTRIKQMFFYCKSIPMLDLRNFDISFMNQGDATEAFFQCHVLEEIKVDENGGFSTRHFGYLESMFENCYVLTKVPEIDISAAYDVHELFRECRAISEIVIKGSGNGENDAYTPLGEKGGFNDIFTGKTTQNMVYGCTSLKRITLKDFKSKLHIQVINNANQVVGINADTFNNMTIGAKGSLTELNIENVTLDAEEGLAGLAQFNSRYDGFTKLQKVTIKNFNLPATTSMTNLFKNCTSLRNVEISNFNASKLEDAQCMFYNCNNLGVDGTDEEGNVITGNLSITESIFNSSNNIHNMSYMFYKCSGLASMPSLDTRAAQNMSNMFYYCNNPSFSEVTDFHIDSATNITSLFEGCSNLTKVGFTGTKNGGTVSASSLTTGNTNKVFNSCSKIEMITFQDHEFSTLGSFYNFLTGAKSSLKQISFNEINAPGLTTFASMFDGFSKLRSVDLSGLVAENVTSAQKMFNGCTNLGLAGDGVDGELDFDGSILTRENQIIDMSYMFSGCNKLPSVPSLDTRNAENMSYMFQNCNSTSFTEVTDFHIDSATNIKYLFSGCKNLTEVGFTGTRNGRTASASALTTGNTENVFNGCSKIAKITFRDHEFSALNSFASFLTGAKSSLKQISFNDINAPGLTTFASMFDGFSKLRSVDLSGLVAENVTSAAKMFNGCTYLGVTGDGVEGKFIFEGSILTKENKITDMSEMFQNCNQVTELDLTGFYTSNVTKMNKMFNKCNMLEYVNVSTFDTAKVTTMEVMFGNADGTNNRKLKTLDISSFHTDSLTNVVDMFLRCVELETIYADPQQWYSWDTNSSHKNGTKNTFKLDAKIKGGNGTPHPYPTSTNEIYYLGYIRVGGWTSPTEKGLFTEKTKASVKLTSSWLTSADLGPVNTVERFVKSSTKGASAVKVGTTTGDYDLYAWRDGNTVYWWTDAVVVKLDADSNELFKGWSNCKTLELDGFDFSDVTNFGYMFEGALNLEHIYGAGNKDYTIRTDHATNMRRMFANCKKLQSLDTRGFNTESVTNMEQMFSGCEALETLSVRSFDTGLVTNMNQMFKSCKALKTLDLRSFSTASLTAAEDMFGTCKGLTDITFGEHFTCENVTSLKYMFGECEALTSLDLSTFKTTNVGNMQDMFYSCKALKSLSFGDDFSTAKVTNMFRMFQGCAELTELDVSGFDTGMVTDMQHMFRECKKLTELDVSGFDTSAVKTFSYMFKNCSSLTSLDLSSFSTDAALLVNDMFGGCSVLTGITFGSGFTCAAVTDMNWMFAECGSLQNLNLSTFNTANVKNMKFMFGKCGILQNLDLSMFNTASVTNMISMFEGCSSLETIYANAPAEVGGFAVEQVTDSIDMFKNCAQLKGGAGTVFDATKTDKTCAHIDEGEENPGYFTAVVGAGE